MNRIFSFGLFFWLLSSSLLGQSLGLSYQAVVRDANGAILTNASIPVRFVIHEGNSTGTVVYDETHTPTTNAYGLVNLVIGDGSPTQGTWSQLDWGSGPYFLHVFLGGEDMGVQRLESVPFAKVATDMQLHQLTDVSLSLAAPGEVLKWDGSQWAPATDQVADSDADPANELQTLSLSGNTLSITNGNSVSLPAGTSYTGGTGISISGSTITNTAPDQTVSLAGSGATSVTGTYPNFTISSTDNVNDADADASNEIQSLSLSGNTLSLSLGGGSVNLSSFGSPWSSSGSNLFYNSGNVGIGDNSPAATLTVGNGDKFQVHGAEGDVIFTDDQASIRFANASGATQPMIQMFTSGTNNATRMLVGHSPSFPSWGIRYNDTSDAFTWIGANVPVLHVQLAGQQRVGIGNESPEAKLHVSTNSAMGFGQLKLTETQFDYARITMNNDIHNNFWDIAARTDTNLNNAQFNIYHSNGGDIFSIRATGRVGINDASPSFPLDVTGNGETRTINAKNTLPATNTSSFNYGVIANLSQSPHTGFPRLFNIYGFSNDPDSYLSYGVYGFADNASNFNYGVYGLSPVSNGYAGYFSGNVYSTGSYLPSDAALKSYIQPLTNGLQTVLSLKPRRYEYDTRKYEFMHLPEGEQYGFVAQEVEQLLPALTRHTFQAYDKPLSDTPEGQGLEFKAVNYIGLIPFMVAGMQEQQEIIEQQAQHIQTQDQKILDLEARLQAIESLLGQ
ncbi:MAG: tail fiber domain-containing protein [Bacteroidetes bacterium]|nr:MAG: tail fiber domain-containing protein [Bacteroidota bacterium]